MPAESVGGVVTVVEILRRAKDRIAHPSCWTDGASARDVDGNRVRGDSPLAVAWCAKGALDSVTAASTHSRITAAAFLDQAARKHFGMTLICVNDRHGMSSVAKVYDHAIYAATAAGA